MFYKKFIPSLYPEVNKVLSLQPKELKNNKEWQQRKK